MRSESQNVYRLFENQAERTPDVVALVEDDHHVTYRCLNVRVVILARQLLFADGRRGAFVGVHLPRSIDLLVSLLGVLRAGGVYVPLDPSLPDDRLKTIIAETRTELVIERSGQETCCRDGVRICVDTLPVAESEGLGSEMSQIECEEACCVLFTSGSTGRPLGVRISHRQALTRIRWMWEHWPFLPDDVAVMHRSPTLVGSLWDSFGPLLSGTRTVVIPQGENTAGIRTLFNVIAKHGISHLCVSPTLLAVLLDYAESRHEELSTLRHCMVAGEQLTGRMVRTWKHRFPIARLINVYGTTECNTPLAYDTSRWNGSDDTNVPVGKPTTGASISIIDETGAAVIPGQIGEIVVRGPCVALGYLNEELSRKRFAPDSSHGGTLGRLFYTGDWGRYCPDGNVEVVGRRDSLVKIRGFRVSAEEVEASLRACVGVKAGAVVVDQDTTGITRLIGYIVSHRPGGEIKEELERHLPAHMVPAKIIPVPDIPLTASGKVNRLALKARIDEAKNSDAPLNSASANRDGEIVMGSPSATKATLSRLFAEVLNVSQVSEDEDFFDAGGDSLSVMKLLNRIRHVQGVELIESDVFDYPTVSRLALRIHEVSVTTAKVAYYSGPMNRPLK
jgi:amino acid adenylation domain-containing protein